MANGNVDYTITLGVEFEKSVDKIIDNKLVEVQKRIEDNTIVIKMNCDEKDFLKQMDKLVKYSPEIAAKITVVVDDKDLTKQLDFIEKSTGKSAKNISTLFKKNIQTGFENVNLKDILADEFGKGTNKAESNLRKLFDSLKNEIGSFSFDNTSLNDIENQARAYQKLLILQKELKGTDKESLFDFSSFGKQVNDFYTKAGQFISSNTSALREQIEIQYKKEQNDFQKSFTNLINGRLNAPQESIFGEKSFESLEELDKAIETVKKKIDEINKKKIELSLITKQDIEGSLLNIGNQSSTSDRKDAIKDYLNIVRQYVEAGNQPDEETKRLYNEYGSQKNLFKKGEEFIPLESIKTAEDQLVNLQTELGKLEAKYKEVTQIITNSGNNVPEPKRSKSILPDIKDIEDRIKTIEQLQKKVTELSESRSIDNLNDLLADILYYEEDLTDPEDLTKKYGSIDNAKQVAVSLYQNAKKAGTGLSDLSDDVRAFFKEILNDESFSTLEEELKSLNNKLKEISQTSNDAASNAKQLTEGYNKEKTSKDNAPGAPNKTVPDIKNEKNLSAEAQNFQLLCNIIEQINNSIGEKTKAIESEVNAAKKLLPDEVSEFDKLKKVLEDIGSKFENVSSLIQSLNNIQKNDVSSLGIKFDELPDSEKLNKFVEIINKLIPLLNEISKLSLPDSLFSNFDITKAKVNNLTDFVVTIEMLQQALQKFDNESVSVLNNIKEITKNSDSLKSLATVITASPKAVERAKKNAGNNAAPTEDEQDYKTVLKNAKKYYSLSYKSNYDTLTDKEAVFLSNNKKLFGDLDEDSDKLKKLIDQYKDLADFIDKAKQDAKKDASTEFINKQTKNLQSYFSLLEKSEIGILSSNERAKFEKLKDQIGTVTGESEKLRESFDFAGDAIENFKKAYTEAFKTSSDNFIKKTTKTLDNFKLKDTTPHEYELQKSLADSRVEELEKLIAKYNNNDSAVISNEDLARADTLKKDINEIINKLKTDVSFKSITEISREKLTNKIQKWLADNDNAALQVKNRLRDMLEELKKIDNEDAIKKLNNEFLRLKTTTEKAGKAGNSFFTQWQNKMGDLTAYLTSFASFYDIVDKVRDGINIIREYDTAFTEMKKVADESTQSLKEFQEESFTLASSVGTTAQQLQTSTADWMRLGESLEQAKQSAQDTSVLFNVSEFENINEATDSLVAMSAAYEDLDKMDIIDVLNNIGNNFSISTNELAESLQRSAGTLSVAGNDLYEAVALTTAGNAILRDPDSVGAGLRTISLRITGTEEAAEELSAMGEDAEDVVKTTAEIRQTIKNATAVSSNDYQGFDILDENGNYKSTYEILLGISKVYAEIVEEDKKLGTNRSNLLLETLAGKNRSNIAASILQNPELLENVYTSAQNSEGSAQNELETYLDSIDAKMQELQNRWQELWVSEDNTELVKFFIELATSIVEVTESLGGAKNVLLALTGGFLSLSKNFGKSRLFLFFKYAESISVL